jgi:hypothetical protein
MTATISPSQSPIKSRSSSSKHVGRRSHRAERDRYGTGQDLLGRYADIEGRGREVVALPGFLGSVLVVDRDSSTLGDRRLVAHLASDEPVENAAIACSRYLNDSRGRWSRRVTAEDLETVPLAIEQEIHAAAGAPSNARELVDRHGRVHRLELCVCDKSICELRWCRQVAESEGIGAQVVSVRDVVGALESYEPVRTLTLGAVAWYRRDPEVSVKTVRLELERVDCSPLVLNRGLREAALAVVQWQGLSMSKIAMRCGRIKYDSRGRPSGETSWLARRLGIIASSRDSGPTPWVHTDVLGLIAREGLRISPREVELG